MFVCCSTAEASTRKTIYFSPNKYFKDAIRANFLKNISAPVISKYFTKMMRKTEKTPRYRKNITNETEY